MSSVEAVTRRRVRARRIHFTSLVMVRIFWVSWVWLETFWIAGSIVLDCPLDPLGVISPRTMRTLPGLSGATWKVSGSGLPPSRAYAAGSVFDCCARAWALD